MPEVIIAAVFGSLAAVILMRTIPPAYSFFSGISVRRKTFEGMVQTVKTQENLLWRQSGRIKDLERQIRALECQSAGDKDRLRRLENILRDKLGKFWEKDLP